MFISAYTGDFRLFRAALPLSVLCRGRGNIGSDLDGSIPRDQKLRGDNPPYHHARDVAHILRLYMQGHSGPDIPLHRFPVSGRTDD